MTYTKIIAATASLTSLIALRRRPRSCRNYLALSRFKLRA